MVIFLEFVSIVVFIMIAAGHHHASCTVDAHLSRLNTGVPRVLG